MSKTFRQVKAEFKDKYEAWKIFAVAGYVNNERERPAKDFIEDVAKEMGFIPSYFATIILTEGLGIVYLDNDKNFHKTPPFQVNVDKQISGFDVAGTDDFGSEFSRYKAYLPDDYNEGTTEADLLGDAEFIKDVRINERKDETVSAKFKNMESMVWACGATLAHRRDMFLRHATELGYPTPSEDELAYWTYIYYQGEGQARRWLQSAGSLDIYARNNGCYPDCNVTASTRDANDVALSNLASWRYLQWANIFTE